MEASIFRFNKGSESTKKASREINKLLKTPGFVFKSSHQTSEADETIVTIFHSTKLEELKNDRPRLFATSIQILGLSEETIKILESERIYTIQTLCRYSMSSVRKFFKEHYGVNAKQEWDIFKKSLKDFHLILSSE